MHSLTTTCVVGPAHPVTWAVQVTPLAGESRSSWLLRVMRKNLVSPRAFFRETFHVNITEVDLDFSELPQVVDYFSSRTGTPAGIISGLVPALPFQPKDKGAPTFNPILGKTPKGSYDTCMNGPRFCPACLAADPDPYFRAAWRVGVMSACLTHACLLENKCARCGSVVRPYLLDWKVPLTYCHHCGSDLSKTAPFFIPPRDQNWDALQVLRESRGPEMFGNLYHLMLFIIQHCAPSDPVFKGHVLASSERLLEIWPDPRSVRAAKNALQQPAVLYLLCGPAYSLLQNPEALEHFMRTHQQPIQPRHQQPPLAPENHVYARRVNEWGDVLVCGTVLRVGYRWRGTWVFLTRAIRAFHVSTVDNRHIATIPEYLEVDANVDGRINIRGRTYALGKTWAETRILAASSRYHVRVLSTRGELIAIFPIKAAKREPAVMLKISLSDPARKVYRRHVYRTGIAHVRGKTLQLQQHEIQMLGREVLITEEGGNFQILDDSGRWVASIPSFFEIRVNKEGLIYVWQQIFSLGWQWRYWTVLIDYGVKCIRVYDTDRNFIKSIPLEEGVHTYPLPDGFFA